MPRRGEATLDIRRWSRLDAAGVDLESFLEALDSALEVVDAEAIGDTCLMLTILRIYIEAGTGSHHYGFAIVGEIGEEPLAELVAIVNGKFDHGVESTFRSGAEATGDLVEAFNESVAASYILCANSVEVLLGGVDSSLAEDLTEAGRRQTGHSHTHSCADDILVVGDEGSDTGAASAVTLGNGVEENYVLLNTFELHYAEVFSSVVAELAINLVSKEEEVVFLNQLSNLEELLFGVEVTGGVVGVADHDSAGLGGDSLLKFLDGRQSETVLDGAGDGFDLAVAEHSEGVVVCIVGFGNQDLFTRIETYGESELKGLGTAAGYDDLVFVDVDVVALVVLNEFLTIAEVAVGGSISENADFGFCESLESTLGGLDVGLADVEVDNLGSASLGSIAIGDKFTDCRLGQIVSFLRNLRHGIYCLCVIVCFGKKEKGESGC